MGNEPSLSLLYTPIPTLGLSQELKNISEMHGFFTLADLINQTTNQLTALPGFTQHLLYEYVNFMEAHGFGELIDPM